MLPASQGSSTISLRTNPWRGSFYLPLVTSEAITMKSQHSSALCFNGANISVQNGIILKIEMFLIFFYKERSIKSLQQSLTPLLIYIKLSVFFLTIFSFQLMHSMLAFMANYGTIFRIKLIGRHCYSNRYVLQISLVIMFPFSLVLSGWSQLGCSSCFNCAQSSDNYFSLTSYFRGCSFP